MNTLIAITGLGIICLIAEIFNLRKAIVPITIIGLLAVLGMPFYNIPDAGTFNNMIVPDNFGTAFTNLFIVLTIFLVALSPKFYDNRPTKISDFIAIKLFMLVGAISMVTFGNLAMFFLGIEVLSISLYVLAASEPKNLKSNEAGMKYFIMGSFASGIILFGIALIYGATGTFDTAQILDVAMRNNFGASANIPNWFFIGIVMLTIGLFFKMAAVPFHFWAPDVYEGSPALTTATMSTLAKIAAIAAFFKLMRSMNMSVPGTYMSVISIVSILSMTIGNLMALRQDNVKRMLAFSGISHAGFMLMVFFSPPLMQQELFYYAAAYALAGIAAFAVVLSVCGNKGNENIVNFNGLGKRSPLMAAILTCALLSMGGIPIFSGFFAKFFLFSDVIYTRHYAIVIIAVVNSIISIGYYFKLILAMYTKDSNEVTKTQPISFAYTAVAVLSILLNIAMGLYPQFVLDMV
jgi:NADH-quinone oxidoreductase subunit N